MKPGDAIKLLHAAPVLLLIGACGGESGGHLFDGPGVQSSSSPSSGGAVNYMRTGGSGGLSGTGGSLTDGGSANTGGSSFTPTVDSGADGGNSSVTDASTTDAGFNPALCDFTGTWASYITVPVTWPASIVLLAGSGMLQQWNLTIQTQEPGSLSVSSSSVPCGIFLPDLQSNFFQANAKFGIRFPDALFDDGGIPPTNFVINAVLTNDGIGFATDPFAILIGLTLPNATTAPWPGAQAQLEDHDGDKHPGITVLPATGAGYSLPPGSSNPFDTNRADLLYIAERTISAINGPIRDCDRLDGNVVIESVNGKPAIDSTVVGCHKQDGSECTADDAAFIDTNRPQFTPSGPGTIVNVRVPDGSTCAYVRALFPKQP